MSTVRKLLVALTPCAAVLMMLCWSCPEAADQKEYKVDIPRQALTPALVAFWIQTGVEAGFLGDSPADDNILVGPVSGTLTADAALSQLLLPHDLTYEWVNERYISVAKQQRPAGSAQADASLPTTNSARRWSSDRARNRDVEFVIVIGTRLSSLETESQSVAVVNRQKIDSYGVSTLAELFEYMPQIPYLRSESNRLGGEQFVDLRGLGAGTTSILINGRRIGSSATSFDTGGFDVNTIPLTAVQRVEVLLDSPPVSIGADAIGGVVNIILKDEIPRPTMELRYGAADGGAEERRLSLGVGTSTERFRGAVTLDLFQRDHLLGAERDLTGNQDYRRFGGSDFRSLSASPGNVFSLTSTNLPGLGSRFAAVPIGSTGLDLAPEDFTSTAGQLNRTSLGRFRSLIPESSRLSLVASGELRLPAGLSVFTEMLGTNKRNETQLGPSTLNGAVVPASNAFNPFGVPVAVNTLLQGMDAQTAITETNLGRAVAGLRGTWGRWEGEVSATWTREHAERRNEQELDFVRVTQALGSSDPDTALNVFRDGAPGSHTLLASLVAPPRVRTFSSGSTQGYARAQGPLFALSAGDTMAMFGGEWRREELSNPAMRTSPHRTVAAVFAGIQAPLVDREMHIPAIQELSISAGVRGDDYRDVGTRVTPQYGLTWRPVRDVTLRASHSRAYRPPSLHELYTSRITALVTLADPRRRNEAASFIANFAGNPDLAPSAGRSWTVALDVVPHSIPHWQLSLTYWRTTIDDRIALVPLPTLLGHEDAFSVRIERAEPTAQDREAGLPGVLRSLDTSPGNFGGVKASGMDFHSAFVWDTGFGRFTPNLAATWYDRFSTTLASTVPAEERVGMASEFGTIPEWSAVASIGWSRGPLAGFLAAQFIPSYADASLGQRNGRTIPSQTLIDAQASLQLGAVVSERSFLEDVKLTAGIKDVLDTQSHFSGIGMGAIGYDSSQTNLKQRFWYLRLAKEF